MVCMVWPLKLTSSSKIMTWCVLLNFNNLWFALTFQMAYFKTKFKSSDNKTSPFRPFLVGYTLY
jgi:hypothetical protein